MLSAKCCPFHFSLNVFKEIDDAVALFYTAIFVAMRFSLNFYWVFWRSYLSRSGKLLFPHHMLPRVRIISSIVGQPFTDWDACGRYRHGHFLLFFREWSPQQKINETLNLQKIAHNLPSWGKLCGIYCLGGFGRKLCYNSITPITVHHETSLWNYDERENQIRWDRFHFKSAKMQHSYAAAKVIYYFTEVTKYVQVYAL